MDELGRKRWKNAEGPAWADAQGVTEIEARPGRPGHGAPERCAARAGLRPGGWRAEHASRTNGCCHHRVWWQCVRDAAGPNPLLPGLTVARRCGGSARSTASRGARSSQPRRARVAHRARAGRRPPQLRGDDRPRAPDLPRGAAGPPVPRPPPDRCARPAGRGERGVRRRRWSGRAGGRGWLRWRGGSPWKAGRTRPPGTLGGLCPRAAARRGGWRASPGVRGRRLGRWRGALEPDPAAGSAGRVREGAAAWRASDADAAGNASDTPLHCAAENNDTGAARALQLHARRVAVCVTLAMAQHLRLGAGAEVVGLGAELVREVLALAEM